MFYRRTKRIYRRDIQIAKGYSSNTNDDFMQQISDIENLRKDEEIVIEEGSKEDIFYKKIINIRYLEGSLNDENNNTLCPLIINSFKIFIKDSILVDSPL